MPRAPAPKAGLRPFFRPARPERAPIVDTRTVACRLRLRSASYATHRHGRHAIDRRSAQILRGDRQLVTSEQRGSWKAMAKRRVLAISVHSERGKPPSSGVEKIHRSVDCSCFRCRVPWLYVALATACCECASNSSRRARGGHEKCAALSDSAHHAAPAVRLVDLSARTGDVHVEHRPTKSSVSLSRANSAPAPAARGAGRQGAPRVPGHERGRDTLWHRTCVDRARPGHVADRRWTDDGSARQRDRRRAAERAPRARTRNLIDTVVVLVGSSPSSRPAPGTREKHVVVRRARPFTSPQTRVSYAPRP
jgi:hypothetical protein